MEKKGVYIVLGAEVKDLESNYIKEDSPIDLVGVYRDYEEAKLAWRGKAQATVDNAHMRYFLVPIDEYLLQH